MPCTCISLSPIVTLEFHKQQNSLLFFTERRLGLGDSDTAVCTRITWTSCGEAD